MTKQISLNLTLEELEIIDKFVELDDNTRQLFDKIRSAYPKLKITFENRGDFDVVSYHNPQNSGDEIYWRIEQPNSFSWWRRYIVPHRLDMVQNKEKEQELEQLYHKQLEREMIKRNLKTSLQELSNGDVRPIDDVVKEAKKELVEKQPRTLTDILYGWWGDVFTAHSDWDMETSIEDLVDQVEQWLPKQSNFCEEYSYELGRHHILELIKRNLR